ncbi:hypothetical protein B0H14DRAFT_2635639 [Mycena olivaceomarginata]|nr:hypothetical protein B0H14DRAFT_2635639 [Mycena olivaceomarginata]
MPKNKNQLRTKNLGQFAVKRKRTEIEDSDEEQTSKHPRTHFPDSRGVDECSDSDCSDAETSPDSDIVGRYANNDPNSEDEDENSIEIYEENDIPHPKDHADLVNWLKLSDAHLASLHTSTAPAHRGAYHNNKVGKEVSVRRAQEIRKAEKKRQDRENQEDMRHGLKNTTIKDFFHCKPAPSLPEPEPEIDPPSQEPFDEIIDMDIDTPHTFSDQEEHPDTEELDVLTGTPNDRPVEVLARTTVPAQSRGESRGRS